MIEFITYAFVTVSPLSGVDPETLAYETDWDAIDAAIDAETQS